MSAAECMQDSHGLKAKIVRILSDGGVNMTCLNPFESLCRGVECDELDLVQLFHVLKHFEKNRAVAGIQTHKTRQVGMLRKRIADVLRTLFVAAAILEIAHHRETREIG